VKFLDELLGAKANVLVWPRNLKKLDLGPIKVVKCTGWERNDSGLAMTVQAQRTIVMPGDAAPMFIPELDVAKSDVLVAPHHGAWIHLAGHPRNIVASFGARNTYGHPNYRSVRSWCGTSWRATADRGKVNCTETGSVVVDLCGTPTAPSFCYCAPFDQCNLLYSQTVEV
jgi:hypothetical protein